MSESLITPPKAVENALQEIQPIYKEESRSKIMAETTTDQVTESVFSS